ncbi:MAG: MarR family transcriptional regulator [Candidatus Latescibacterota bacterium]|nr:MAG: MarR family transcriptional regulator [Candidatus Latescibacterota bacterium]
MPVAERTRIINDFLASMHIFHSAVNELMAEQLREDLGGELTIPQFRLLKLVASTNIESISEVAAFSKVTNAAASKAVDRLVKRGLIQRTESTSDRRVSQLSLTGEGHRLLERFETAQHRVLEGLFMQFMPSDFVQTAQLLDRLSADIVDLETGPQEMCFRCGIYFREKCLLRDVAERTCYFHVHKREHGGGAARESGEQV